MLGFYFLPNNLHTYLLIHADQDPGKNNAPRITGRHTAIALMMQMQDVSYFVKNLSFMPFSAQPS